MGNLYTTLSIGSCPLPSLSIDNTFKNMKNYLLLLKGKQTLDYSPEELQKRLEAYRRWAEKLKDQIVDDNRLEREGRYIREKAVIESDGPFLEAKEIIAGYIIIKARDLNEATLLAESSPLLDYFHIIVRPMIEHGSMQ